MLADAPLDFATFPPPSCIEKNGDSECGTVQECHDKETNAYIMAALLCIGFVVVAQLMLFVCSMQVAPVAPRDFDKALEADVLSLERYSMESSVVDHAAESILAKFDKMKKKEEEPEWAGNELVVAS